MNTRASLAIALSAALLAARAPAQADPEPVNARIARSVQEVLMNDFLRVSGASRRELLARGPARGDLVIARDVSRLVLGKLGPSLSGSVVSCTDGVITLRGQVDTGARRDAATGIALRVAGVTAVYNLMLTPDEDASATPVLPPSGEDVPVTAGPFPFVTPTLLGGKDIVVTVSEGSVTVTGEVSSAAARRHVSSVAWAIPGVRAVHNQTVIRRHTSRQDDERLGLITLRSFEHTFALQPVAPAMLVTVRNGVTRLTGRVHTEEQRRLASNLAANVQTILAVDNQLTVSTGFRSSRRD